MSEYERIKRSCLKRGELWEDSEFPATQASVFYHQTPPFQFQWKRPKVSIKKKFHLLNLFGIIFLDKTFYKFILICKRVF